MTMLRKQTVTASVGYLTARFGGRIGEEQQEALWDELDNAGVTEEWLLHACKFIVRDEDSLPRNLLKAILSRRPVTREFIAKEIPINPDTGKPFTDHEAWTGRQRYAALMQIASSPKDNARRKRVMSCAEASAVEGDSAPVMRKWGAHIEAELDVHIMETAP